MPPNDYLRLLGLLAKARIDFVVVGGTAAVLHGSSMATYDLDVLMPFTVENCAGLLSALSEFHPRFSHTPDRRPVSLNAEELSAYRNLYLLTDLGRLDVLGALPPLKTTEEVLKDAEWMEVGGIPIRVVSLEHLIQVKAALGRPKDKFVESELRAIAEVRASARK